MLSIVIPSHNRADLLALCLQSVLRHAPVGTEVLVVDDGSPQGIVSETARRFAGVRVRRRPTPGGFCRAANEGIAATTGEIVELLNDDAEVTANWATRACQWFTDPTIAAVAPLVLQNDPGQSGLPRIDSAGDEYDPGGFAQKRLHNQPLQPLTAGPVWGVSATAGFYRRSVLDQVGYFPVDFGAYFEDVDLSCRIRRAGHGVWFEPASRVWHQVSSSYGRRPRRRTLEQQSCNEERLFWRNTPAPQRWRWLPRHLAVLTGKALRRLEEGQFTPWMSGRLRAWWHQDWREIASLCDKID